VRAAERAPHCPEELFAALEAQATCRRLGGGFLRPVAARLFLRHRPSAAGSSDPREVGESAWPTAAACRMMRNLGPFSAAGEQRARSVFSDGAEAFRRRTAPPVDATSRRPRNSVGMLALRRPRPMTRAGSCHPSPRDARRRPPCIDPATPARTCAAVQTPQVASSTPPGSSTWFDMDRPGERGRLRPQDPAATSPAAPSSCRSSRPPRSGASSGSFRQRAVRGRWTARAAWRMARRSSCRSASSTAPPRPTAPSCRRRFEGRALGHGCPGGEPPSGVHPPAAGSCWGRAEFPGVRNALRSTLNF